MATIVAFRRYKMDVTDRRDITENLIRDSIKLKTSDRVNWNTLRKMRPVPQWGEPHPTEPGFYFDYANPVHVSRLVWELECEYTPYKGGQIDPDPLARPPVITFETSLVEQPTLFDNQDRPIVNRAAEFILGVMEQIPLVDYNVVKNLSDDPKTLLTHLGAVNNDTVKLRGITWAPRTLLLAGISGGDYTTENRSRFAPFTFKILADYRTWDITVWNKGTVELKPVERTINGRLKVVYVQVPIQEGDPLEPVSEPVPLDENGRRIVDAITKDGDRTLDKQKLIQLTFRVQRERPFSELPLK